MKVEVLTLPKGTLKLDITVSVDEIKKSSDKVWGEVVKNAEIDGFRKGNAPVDMVKQKVDARKVESEILSEVIKTYYPLAIEDQKLQPVIAPKIELDDFNPEKELNFTATTALRPVVTVGDYKKALKEVYDKKNAEVQKPEVTDANIPVSEGDNHDHIHLTPNEITDAVLTVANAEIADILIEDEANKMLSRLINQIQSLKMDMDAYLKSQNKTAEDLKAEYAQIAQKSIAGELALMEVVKLEGVEVSDEEIDQTIKALGDPKLQEQYSQDEYQKAYIRSIISKNKVIWKLSSPDSEEHSPEAKETQANPDEKKEEPDVKN